MAKHAPRAPVPTSKPVYPEFYRDGFAPSKYVTRDKEFHTVLVTELLEHYGMLGPVGALCRQLLDQVKGTTIGGQGYDVVGVRVKTLQVDLILTKKEGLK